jgi:F-type H+-transporting ATPase subunit b
MMKAVQGFSVKFSALVLFATVFLAASSAALAASAGHVDSGVLLKDFLYRVLNFAVMFGILAYFITKPIRKGMAGRREGIEKSLREAKMAKEEAEARFAEYESKLTRASAEIDEITASIRREGEAEREKILTNARLMAEKIRTEAEKSAAYEMTKARTELRREASALAIRMAEEILKKNISEGDHVRLIDEYMQKVGELH